MRGRVALNFNTDWLYYPGSIQGGEDPGLSEARFQSVSLPHANVEVPHHYFTEEAYRFVSWYRRHFRVDRQYRGCRLFLDFEGVLTVASVYLNGRLLQVHEGGYTPFSVEITDCVRFDEDNVLAVEVDSRYHPDIPPEGGKRADFMLFGGIYRNVRLRVVNPVHVDWVFVLTPMVSDDVAVVRVRARLDAGGCAAAAGLLGPSVDGMEWRVTALDGTGREVARGAAAPVGRGGDAGDRPGGAGDAPATGELLVERELTVSNPHRWDLRDPHLYTLVVELVHRGIPGDRCAVRFGIREASFGADGVFRLNGRPLKLRGLNRHQNYPYVGPAMPDRMQRTDADILRFELGLNIVRTSHYPQSPAFLDRCDEIGLLVMEEIPGWQYLGDSAWKKRCLQNLRDMIVRDRNHPSIVLWGVRVNESRDDHQFHAETNRLAHELDPSRQTGGSRDFNGSEFLEDVFTLNDFSGGIQEPLHRPHLITEYCGHTFPTKSYDNEERQVQHALYHAHVQNLSYGHPGVAGAIGWCAFDYNTDRNFGSGDCICYHGVMDIFRLPKFAAYFYQSQRDPVEGVVLFPATHWTTGDRSGGGVDPVVIFSNCEEIDAYLDGEFKVTLRPSRDQFRNLPHPPFVLNGLIDTWRVAEVELELVGKIGGREVARVRKRTTGGLDHLELAADHRELVADGADCTRVVATICDEAGDRLPYAHNPVSFVVDGPAVIVGENPMSAEAGRAVVYVRAGRTPGRVIVRASSARLKDAEVEIGVVALPPN